MNVAEQIELSEACNWSTGVSFGLADQLNVAVVGNVCIVTERVAEFKFVQVTLFSMELRDLIPVLESALKELKARGNLADKRYKSKERSLPRET